MPETNNLRQNLKTSLRNKINGVFTSSIESSIYQAVFTWMLLDLWQVEYVFVYCLGAAFFRVVPSVSTVMIGVVAATHCFLVREKLLLAAALFLVYAYVDSRLT